MHPRRNRTTGEGRPLPPWLLVLLLALFFGSGASALTYQVLWHRQLSLVFGVTVYATTTVLAAFMSGLALGSSLAGRFAERTVSPLGAFGLIEIGIGVTAFATQWALPWLTAAYPVLHAVLPTGVGATVFRFGCAMLVLAVPTVLMGMTLPLVLKGVVDHGGSPHRRIGWFYAANTFGAVTGALLTGFLLIGGIGMRASFGLAAGLNVLVGVVALAVARAHGLPSAAAPSPDDRRGRTATVGLVIFALSGMGSLALEVVWFRLLVYFVPATTYAFTTMLASVLLGLAAGSWMVSSLPARTRDWLRLLAAIQLATALCVPLAVSLLVTLYGAGWHTTGDWHVSLLIVLPPTLLLGMAYPIGLRVWGGARTPAHGLDGARVGDLNAANLLGGIVGAIAGGFVLLPWLGTRGALAVLGGTYLVAFVLVLRLLDLRVSSRVALAAVGVAAYLGAALSTPDVLSRATARRHPAGERLAWREEGLQTTAAVHVRPRGGRFLYLDGLHQASDDPEMVRLHRLIGHLPMVLHPHPRRALVVGLGGGVTPGAVSQHDVQVVLVELSRAVTNAAHWFTHVNYDVLNRPNVRLRVDDGRNHLLITRERYDVVTADLIQPDHAGAGNLYSREYFALVRRALAEDGLVLQWLGHRAERDYKLILRTFLDVFPHTTLWADGQLMVGAVRPLRIDRTAFDAKVARPATRRALEEIDLGGFDNLLGLYTAGPDELRAFVGDGPLLVDDRPRVEYFKSGRRDGTRPLSLEGLAGAVERHLDEPR